MLTVRPVAGASNASIAGLDPAFGVVLAVWDLAREIACAVRPLGAASLPGHAGGVRGSLRWDLGTGPTTQSYEDLAIDGYESAFVLPN
jgi:hypothetical protein